MIQKPKGTKDIYGNDQDIYIFIFESFIKLVNSYNLQKITTPIFEYSSLFRDASGEVSDIVTKELYLFRDLSNRELALRPEGTAAVARALIENKLLDNKSFKKLYYIGPMFRYEKPQKGRLRQFYQIGVELIGDKSIYSVIESIQLADAFLKKLKLTDVVLKINNIGSKKERNDYEKALSKYFNNNKSSLSELSISRIDINPLRILDDKIDSKKTVVINAPKIIDFLSSESKQEFEKLLSLLTVFNISYEVDLSLVRGLDYYTNIVFEFESNTKKLGSKSTIIGGGCYNNLIKNSNKEIDGVGFGVGVERIFEILKDTNIIQDKKIDAYFIINNEKEFKEMFPVICNLRSKNLIIDFNKKFNKSSKIFSNAIHFNPKKLVYYESFEDNIIIIKDIDKNVKINIEKEKIVEVILERIKNEKNK